MKLLSITVPCYNSQDYLNKCVDSLLVGGEEVEILLVNDGSTDRTRQIAEAYAEKYPMIVKVINKENGGHGSAINAGIAAATGLFFKVVDSDDWVNAEAYRKVLDTLSELVGGSRGLDMLVSNFVYEKAGAKRKKVMQYRHAFPKDRIFGWNEMHRLHKGQYILMHSVIFRTKLLRECGIVLPEHTFYVDNLFVFEPLPYVKNIYYLDVNFYRYFIGRDDQSVNEKVMISRIDQQLLVNRRMIDYLTGLDKKTVSGKVRSYMTSYLEIIMTVSSIMLIRAETEEALQKKKELWSYLRRKDIFLYYRLRYGIIGGTTNLPGKGGRKISVEGYKICRKIFKFN
jgi:glycosyltransferase involved in cell wall biosynthesis